MLFLPPGGHTRGGQTQSASSGGPGVRGRKSGGESPALAGCKPRWGPVLRSPSTCRVSGALTGLCLCPGFPAESKCAPQRAAFAPPRRGLSASRPGAASRRSHSGPARLSSRGRLGRGTQERGRWLRSPCGRRAQRAASRPAQNPVVRPAAGGAGGRGSRSSPHPPPRGS